MWKSSGSSIFFCIVEVARVESVMPPEGLELLNLKTERP